MSSYFPTTRDDFAIKIHAVPLRFLVLMNTIWIPLLGGTPLTKPSISLTRCSDLPHSSHPGGESVVPAGTFVTIATEVRKVTAGRQQDGPIEDDEAEIHSPARCKRRRLPVRCGVTTNHDHPCWLCEPEF